MEYKFFGKRNLDPEHRCTSSWIKTDPPLMSPIVEYISKNQIGWELTDLILKEKEDYSKGIRDKKYSISGINAEKIWNFARGFKLEDLTEAEDMQNFYTKQGIEYAEGVVSRFNKESFLKYFSKMPLFKREATEFIENYQNKDNSLNKNQKL